MDPTKLFLSKDFDVKLLNLRCFHPFSSFPSSSSPSLLFLNFLFFPSPILLSPPFLHMFLSFFLSFFDKGEETTCKENMSRGRQEGQVRNLDLTYTHFWEGTGNLFMYSCLENPMDWRVWQTIGHKVRRDWAARWWWWWWYIKQINNKDLQYSTGNSIQYLVITYNWRESKEKNMYIFIHTYVQEDHFALHLKLRQHCK